MASGKQKVAEGENEMSMELEATHLQPEGKI